MKKIVNKNLKISTMNTQKQTLVSIMLVSAATAHAVDLPTATQQANDDWRNQQQKIQELQQEQHEKAAWTLQQNQANQPTKSGADRFIKSDKERAEELQAATESTECLPQSKFVITGMNWLDPNDFRLPENECLSAKTLNQLSREITAAYIKKGYASTQLDFANEGDTVTIAVREMKIREITGGSRKVNVATLFPNHKDKPLNVQYLDQGIDQANKVSGNNVSMDVYPHDDGTATIELKNEASKPWFGQITVDNKGSKPNRAVARLSAGVASPLGLSDSLYVGAYANMARNENHSQGANLFYTVPYGAWTFSAYGSVSDSRSITEFASGAKLNYDSKNKAAGVKAERMISRGQKHITYAHAGVDYLNILSEYGGSKIAMQSPKLGVVQAGLSHTQTLDKGVWLSDLTVERGTRMFGAKDTDLSPFTSQFTNFVANTTLSQNRRLGQSKWILRNQHRASVQFSDDDLYSTKQIGVTDRSSVRGFANLTLNGNKGAYLNNTVFARRYLDNGFYIEPYLGADAGVVKDETGWQRAFGGTVGLNFAYGSKWQINLENAYGVAYPKETDKIRQQQVTASIKFLF